MSKPKRKKKVKKTINFVATANDYPEAEEYQCSGCKNVVYASEEVPSLPATCPWCKGEYENYDTEEWY